MSIQKIYLVRRWSHDPFASMDSATDYQVAGLITTDKTRAEAFIKAHPKDEYEIEEFDDGEEYPMI